MGIYGRRLVGLPGVWWLMHGWSEFERCLADLGRMFPAPWHDRSTDGVSEVICGQCETTCWASWQFAQAWSYQEQLPWCDARTTSHRNEVRNVVSWHRVKVWTLGCSGTRTLYQNLNLRSVYRIGAITNNKSNQISSSEIRLLQKTVKTLQKISREI